MKLVAFLTKPFLKVYNGEFENEIVETLCNSKIFFVLIMETKVIP